jgi:hypothetical protein
MRLDPKKPLPRYYLFLVGFMGDGELKEYRRRRALRDGTNLCGYVNRIFWGTLFLFAGVALLTACVLLIAFFAVVFLIVLPYQLAWYAPVFSTAALLGVWYWRKKVLNKSFNAVVAITESTPVQYLAARKQRICPIIKFDSEAVSQ